MKKIILFTSFVLLLVSIGISNASTAYLNDDLSIHIPCVMYSGSYYELSFQPVFFDEQSSSSSSDTEKSIHWILLSIIDSSPDANCIRIDDNGLKVIVENLQYEDQSFGLSLHPHIEENQLYWQPEIIYEIAASEKERNVIFSDFSGKAADIAENLNDFTMALYKMMTQEGENLIYSPYSISSALSMALAGAKNETAQQMKATLQFDGDDSLIHKGFNYFDVELESRGEKAQGQDGNGFRLNISNNIWGQKGFPFVAEYLDTLAVNYGAHLALLDFAQAPETARRTINSWVSDQTEEKIENLIPQGAIGTLTRLVLTNAIYFNAAWQFPFETEYTVENEPFHVSETETVNVSMMRQTEYFNYAGTDEFQAIELPYDGEELSMVVILPNLYNLVDFEEKMTMEQLNDILESMSGRNVRLEMPKFKLEPEGISLKQILQKMGMTTPFSSDADFSGITVDRELFISDVIHKAFINVDEAGTEAAAATAVIFDESSIMPGEAVEMKINRPFIFLIRDVKTGVILFSGRVVSPA